MCSTILGEFDPGYVVLLNSLAQRAPNWTRVRGTMHDPHVGSDSWDDLTENGDPIGDSRYLTCTGTWCARVTVTIESMQRYGENRTNCRAVDCGLRQAACGSRNREDGAMLSICEIFHIGVGVVSVELTAVWQSITCTVLAIA